MSTVLGLVVTCAIVAAIIAAVQLSWHCKTVRCIPALAAVFSLAYFIVLILTRGLLGSETSLSAVVAAAIVLYIELVLARWTVWKYCDGLWTWHKPQPAEDDEN